MSIAKSHFALMTFLKFFYGNAMIGRTWKIDGKHHPPQHAAKSFHLVLVFIYGNSIPLSSVKMRVQVTLSAENLKNTSRLRLQMADPYAVVTITGGPYEGKEVGRTET